MLQTLPVIPLRGMVVLPGEIVHCDAGRKKTLNAIQAAASSDGLAFFCAQKDVDVNNPDTGDLHRAGTICQIRQVFRLQGEGIHMLVSGMTRAYVRQYTSEEPYFEASITEMAEIEGKPAMILALRRRVKEYFAEYAKLTNKITAAQCAAMEEHSDPARYADAVAAVVIADAKEKQTMLEEVRVEQRLLSLTTFLYGELQVLHVDADISMKLREEIEKTQKEHYLREKIRVIRKELGENEEQDTDVFRRRMEGKELPPAVRQRLQKEIDRLSMLPNGSHEAPMARSFIELALDLSWAEQTEDNLDISHAREVLEENHYGMEKVKERILEYLAVQKLTGKPSGQILCLVGPPGVGKTSIVSSIAACMGRKFVRMSLGGVRDEAEIRGHRRTYIGAMPGRVISAMRQAGFMNPVLLFDEIDKLASDFRGDPAAAMLEVLDSAQNFEFKDHFLELPYDLSKAMLLTTANDVQGIPKPLLDRMELLHVQSYLAEEKLIIAKRHLLPKQMEKHGLKKSNLRIADGSIGNMIQDYTREAGVRELERTLGAVCRKAACEIVEGKSRVVINAGKLTAFLGQPKYRHDDARTLDEVGVVTGLAYTPVGGETIHVEATVVPGSGNVQLTGQLGEIMQESGKAAMTYARAHAREWGLSSEEINKLDVHIHVPQGAVPKDGPSAGVAMAAAILSALTGIPARADMAMTGEITLRGRVLAIGGVREKTLAALRAGITNIMLPEDNKKDTEEIPAAARTAMSITYVETLEQALNLLLGKPRSKAEVKQGAFPILESVPLPKYTVDGMPV